MGKGGGRQPRAGTGRGGGGMKVADGAWKRARVVQIEGRAWAPSPGRGAVAAPARPAPRRDPRTESRTRLIRREPSQNRVLGVHRDRARAHAPARARAHVRSRERDFFPRPDEKQQRHAAARRSRGSALPEQGSTRGGREKKKRRYVASLKIPFPTVFPTAFCARGFDRTLKSTGDERRTKPSGTFCNSKIDRLNCLDRQNFFSRQNVSPMNDQS